MASSRGDSDGSFTPSDASDASERSDRDSDYESDVEHLESKGALNIQWTGYSKKMPVILFNADCILQKISSLKTVGERYHMAYKFGNSECKIVKNILHSHGFHEVHPNSSDYNLVWTGAHLKPFTLRSLTEFQKINHFPRSYELTRKDRLYKNIQRMQQIKGPKNFDIVPSSYVLPGEYQEFCAAFLKDKGPWIVKPVASSRGRGVFLVNHPDQIPLDENVIVSRYLSNPLLIDGFKFDIRLYVAVTSYDPIQIYLYEEGLTRFATVKYEKNQRHIRNQCMHLTNYSVNKKNDEYVQNDDADVEDYGNKWSIGAMLRYLRSNGKDTAALMMKIEDCIIKTILSVELPIGTACKMFMPFRGNCFELYGFDILIDDNYKPWVLEVNLSPSLACDSPLDLKIKGNMLCDLFALTGIMCHDPMMRTMAQSRRNLDVTAKIAARAKSARFRTNPTVLKQRPSSAGSIKKGAEPKDPSASTNKSMQGLNSDEIKILRRAKEEDQRKGGWVRIFPTSDSWDLYSSFLQFTTSHNLMLHQKLYPERHKSSSTASVARGSTSAGMRAKSAYIQLANNQIKPTLELAAAYAQAILRTKQYERKLGTHRPGRRSKRKRRAQSKKNRAKLVQGVAEDSGDDNENEEEENEEDEKPINEENISARNNPSSSNRIELVDSAKLKEEIIQIVVEKDSSHKQDQGQKRTGLASLSKSVPIQHASGNIQVDVGGVDVDDRTPSPPPVKVEPKYNVVDLLQNGHTLSKVQARTAFAMYLVRVQQRLMTDCSVMSTDDVEGLNEQMDLVLRFLKRAAVNLQQSFKVVVPSRKLPLNDRRRILAKQLGDFVHVYNKDFLKHKKPIVVETEQLRSRKQLEHKHTHLRRAESIEGLNEDKFDRFINIASEGELEEVLTTYTKINKSASIFLGSKTSSETHSGNHVPTTGNSMQHIGATASVTSLRAGGSDTNLSKRRESVASTESVPKTVSGWEDIPKVIYSVPTSSGEHRPPSTHSAPAGPPARNVPASYSTISAASYANAVQVYTQKLTTRPRSATLGQQKSGSHGGERVTRSRPASAQMVRPMSASTYGSASDLQDPYNEKVISEALQRLTMRQQARQYSAFNGTSLLPEGAIPPDHVIDPKEWQTLPDTGAPHSTNAGHMPVQYERANIDMHSGKYIVVDDHLHKSKNRPPSGANQKRGHSSVDYRSLHSRKQTNVNLQNANATFNSFIEDAGANWQNDINAIAYNQVTGVVPQNYHTPSQASKQYQILQQQTLKQQSKALLEQSKAKHQAMIAQAHAVQKSLERVDRPESAMSTHIYAPKPPIKPGTRKATSAHHRVAKRAVPEETSLNFNFYSSSKSAVNGVPTLYGFVEKCEKYRSILLVVLPNS